MSGGHGTGADQGTIAEHGAGTHQGTSGEQA